MTKFTAKRLWKRKALAAHLDRSPSWLDREWRAGRFPAPIRLSPRSLMWDDREVEGWITARVAERDAAPSRH